MKNTSQPAAKTGISCEQLFGLFPDSGVYVLTSAVDDAAFSFISQPEAACIADAVPKRRREFATARALAREGLERFFGLHDFNLLNDRNRAPIWPPGITGSLSHSSTRAWVALVDASYGTIGIDGENRDGLERRLWHLILCNEEIAYLENLGTSIQERRALVIYCAKEALYKAQFPLTQKFVDFKAAQVRLDEDGSLRCILQRDFEPLQTGFAARGCWSEELEVLTTVSIPSLESMI
jgi:4'-phosphopantetheinyl transferase EntD